MIYGDLTSLIHFVAMELCTDLELKEQLKKDNFKVMNLVVFVKTLASQVLKLLLQKGFQRKNDLENRHLKEDPQKKKDILKEREVGKHLVTHLTKTNVGLVESLDTSLLIFLETKEKERRSIFLKKMK